MRRIGGSQQGEEMGYTGGLGVLVESEQDEEMGYRVHGGYRGPVSKVRDWDTGV